MPGKPKAVSLPTHNEAVEFDEDRQLSAELASRVAAEGKELEPLADSPALNRLLLRNARRSPNEIAAMTGIPAEEVAERLSVLLDNRSWRDDLMEEKLLLADAADLMANIRERLDRLGMDDEAWFSGARVQLQVIKVLLEQLADRRKAVDGKLSSLTMEQAQDFAATIKMAHDIMMTALERKYPDLDQEIIYAEWEEALPQAIERLEKKATANA